MNTFPAGLPHGSRARRNSIVTLALATTALVGLSAHPSIAAGALPTGGAFAAGVGTISSTSSGLAINQSTARGVITWQSFSIGAGELVQINNGAGATLNRVTGTDISTIAGTLRSTGSVYLVNPYGVIVAPGGQVFTTGSFVASSRDVSNAAFMQGGTLEFQGSSAGTVVNQGTLTSSSGDVVLIGRSVENDGRISAANGTAGLAAGDDVLLLQPATGDQRIFISAGSGDATNTGTMSAAQVELNAAGGNVYALAGNTGGLVSATGTTTLNGHVWLTAGQNIEVSGTVAAKNVDGSGGEVDMAGGPTSGTLTLSGTVDASGASGNGGTVTMTAADVSLGASAVVNADGAANGGIILIGGDRSGGSNPSLDLASAPIADADETSIAAGAAITADAGSGDGGSVVVWSQQETDFAGAVSAHGGGGNGGFAEVSSHGLLGFTGTVDLLASGGTTGTLLLDPANVTISTSATSNDALSSGTYAPSSGSNTSTILNTDLENALASSSVTVTTTNSGAAGSGAGTITISAPVAWSSANALTLSAASGAGITISAAADTISNSGGAAITLIGDTLTLPSTAATLISTTGTVTIAPATASTAINIGSGSGLLLKASGNGSVATINAGTLVIGAASAGGNPTTGTITVNAALSKSAGLANITNVEFLSGAGIVSIGSAVTLNSTGVFTINTSGSVSATAAITVSGAGGGVLLEGGGAFSLTSASNSIPMVAGSGASIALVDSVALTVNTVGGVSGLVSTGSTGLSLTDTAAGGITTTASTGTVSSNGAGPITLKANALTLNGSVTASGQTLTILPSTAGTAMNIAGSSGLNLTQAELNTITATTLIVGSTASTGALTVAGTATLPSTIANLDLITGAAAGITFTTGAVLTDGNSGGNVTLEANKVVLTNGSSGVKANGTGGTVTILPKTATTTMSLAGSSTMNLTQAALNNITASTLIFGSLAGNGTAGAAATGDLTVGGAITVPSTIGTLELETACPAACSASTGIITISNGGSITTSSGGGVILADGNEFVNSDGSGALVASGTNARWLVYSQTPANDTKDGLVYAFKQYGTALLGALNGAIASGQSGFVYATAATATVSLVGAVTETYDDATTATLSAANYSVSATTDPHNADTVVVNEPSSGTFGQKDTGTGITVSVSGLSVVSATDSTGAAVYGYTLTSSSPSAAIGTITAKPLTIAGLSAANKVYDATETATVMGTAGLLTAETTGSGSTADGTPYSGDTVTISGTASGTFAAKDVGSGIAVTLSGLTLGGAQASDYSISPMSVTANITPKTLTVSGLSASNMVYDASEVATLTGTAALLGAETAGGGSTSDDKPYSGDTVTVSGTASGTFAAKDVGTGIAVALSGLTLAGAQASDYTLTEPSLSANITPKTLTITGLGAANMVYDASEVATLTGTASLLAAETAGSGSTSDDKPYSGDTVTVSGTASGTFAAKDAGTGIAVAVSGLTLSGAQASDYTLSEPSLSANITPKSLTVSGLSAANKVYDATETAAVTGTAALLTAEAAGTGSTSDDTPYAGDTVTISGAASGTFAAKDVGTGIAVTLSGLTLGGAQAGDYSISPMSVTANITPKTLTVSGLSASNMVYDASEVATLTGTASLLGAETAGGGSTSDDKPYSGDTVSVSGTASGTFAAKDVGTGIAVTLSGLTLAGAQASDYTLTEPSLSANITPKPLSIAGLSAANKVYDATTTATVMGTAGLLGAETAGSGSTADGTPYSGDTVMVSGTASGIFAAKDAGTGIAVTLSGLTLGGAQAGDYSISPMSVTANITPKTLTVSGLSASNKVYDATENATVTGTPSLLTGETAGAGSTADGTPYSGDTVSVSGTVTGTFAQANAGTGIAVNLSPSLTLSGAQASDYTLTAPASLAATIAKAALTLTAQSNTKTYDGGTSAAATPTTSGLKGSDSVTSLSESYTTSNASTGLTLDVNGGYVVNDGNGGNNYTVTLVPNTSGVINPLAVTLGGAVPFTGSTTVSSSNLAVTNLIGADAVTLTGSAMIASASVGPEAITSVSSLGLGGPSAGNYTLTGASGSVTVSAAALAVTLGGSETYNGSVTAPASILTVTNRIGGTSVTLSGSATLASANVGAEAIASLAGLTLGGADAADYTLTGGSGAVTVTALAVSLAATQIYNGSTAVAVSGLSVADLVSGDHLTLAGSATLAAKNVGSEAIASLTGLTLGGASAGNYTLTGGSGAVTVTPLPVTLAGTETYGGSTTAAASSLSVTNLVSGDALTLSGSAMLAGKNAGPEALASLAGLALGGASAADYTLTGGSGAVTVSPLTVILGGSDTYSGTTAAAATGLSIANLVAGDALTLSGAAAIASKNTGSEAITGVSGLTLAGASAPDYTLTGASGSVTISPAALTIAANNLSMVVGAASLPSLTLSYTGFVGGDTSSVLSPLPTAATTATTSSPIGPYPITVSGAGSTNYTIAYVAGTLSIVPVSSPAPTPTPPTPSPTPSTPSAALIVVSTVPPLTTVAFTAPPVLASLGNFSLDILAQQFNAIAPAAGGATVPAEPTPQHPGLNVVCAASGGATLSITCTQ